MKKNRKLFRLLSGLLSNGYIYLFIYLIYLWYIIYIYICILSREQWCCDHQYSAPECKFFQLRLCLICYRLFDLLQFFFLYISSLRLNVRTNRDVTTNRIIPTQELVSICNYYTNLYMIQANSNKTRSEKSMSLWSSRGTHARNIEKLRKKSAKAKVG